MEDESSDLLSWLSSCPKRFSFLLTCWRSDTPSPFSGDMLTGVGSVEYVLLHSEIRRTWSQVEVLERIHMQDITQLDIHTFLVYDIDIVLCTSIPVGIAWKFSTWINSYAKLCATARWLLKWETSICPRANEKLHWWATKHTQAHLNTLRRLVDSEQ